MNAYLLLGLMGAIASIISAVASPRLRSRTVHSVYGFCITIIAGSAVLQAEQNQKIIEQKKYEVQAARSEVAYLESIQKKARNILSQGNCSSINSVGESRGLILSAFSFLETYKERYPETFKISNELITNGLNISVSSGSVGSEGYYDERKRMADGAAAMCMLLTGISGKDDI